MRATGGIADAEAPNSQKITANVAPDIVELLAIKW